MDTNNKINYHSKEKLRVYKEYLKEYLSVMLKINIVDAFISEIYVKLKNIRMVW